MRGNAAGGVNAQATVIGAKREDAAQWAAARQSRRGGERPLTQSARRGGAWLCALFGEAEVFDAF